MADTAKPDEVHDSTAVADCQWRLRYEIGDLTHFTEWTPDFPIVENYYEQFRRETLVNATTIERREVL